MRAPYCLPIIASDSTKVLEIIQNNLADYHYFEIWLDYLDAPDDAFIGQLAKLLADRLVIVFRRQHLEPIIMASQRRETILNMLSNTACLVDLDISTQRAELDYIRDQQLVIRTIVSYHDYQQTADSVRLEAIIATMLASTASAVTWLKSIAVLISPTCST